MATKLTNSYLKKLKYEGKQIKIRDSAEQGLIFTLGEKKRAFSVYISIKGKRKFETIGYFPEFTIEEAREKARKYKKAAREGLALVDTLNELAKKYFKAKEPPALAVATYRKYELDWDNKFSDWHLIAPADLTVERCRKKFSVLTQKHGPIAANNAIIVPQTIITWAIGEGELPQTFANPINFVSKNKTSIRKRFMSLEELGFYWDGLEELVEGGRHWVMSLHALRYLLLTGRRKEEALGLKWSYLNFEDMTVTYPDTKTGEKTFSLSDETIEVLQKVPKIKGCSFVFSSFGKSDRAIDEHTLYKAHNDICKMKGLVDLRVHDLRRTVGSQLRLAGVELADISDALGYADIATTKEHYAHLDAAANKKNADVVSAIMKKRI